VVTPVEPEVKKVTAEHDADYITRKGEQAAAIVAKYLEGVSIIYDIDERWIMKAVIKKLEAKVRDV
jgi:hypothetical protein